MNFQWIELYSQKDMEATWIVDIPRNKHILAIQIKGIKGEDKVKIEADMQTIFEGKGNFNCGHYFINLDPRHFSELKIRLELASKRKKVTIHLFQEKI